MHKLALLTLLTSSLFVAFSQPPDRRQGGMPEGAFMRFNPLLAALDTDRDGVISDTEITNASKALKVLDKNNDGKLTEDELRPSQSGRQGGQAGQAGQGGRPNGPRDLMSFDKNGDGKLSKDELPE